MRSSGLENPTPFWSRFCEPPLPKAGGSGQNTSWEVRNSNLVFVGTYLVYRGVNEERSVFLVSGSVAIVLGSSYAAVIAIKGLRPWRRTVGIAWTILLLLAFAIIRAFDAMGRPLLR